MHVINRPNIKGVDCNVQQHFIEFPNPYGNPPNHPNYRLGPLDGSPCDTLGINNHPLADFRPDPSDTNHLAIRFWDVSSYEPAEWLWNFGDGSPISQDTSPMHTFPAPGFYTVCLTVGNPYGVSSKCKVVEVKVSGTNAEPSGQGERSAVIFYPNPTTGWIEWNAIAGEESMRIRVYDALGRLCFERETSENKANLSELPDGVYFVSLLGGNGSIVATKAIVLAKK
jgi:PKD repeat protein